MEPSIAVQICKQQQPDRLFEFISALHTDIYVHGLKTAIAKDYGRLAEKMNFDIKNFINDIQNEKYKILAQEDFQNGNALNVDSYPAVLMRYKGELRVISQGYVDWEELSKKISNAIKQ
jgi:protein-disulfide isomerase-like protein with CxxC motif